MTKEIKSYIIKCMSYSIVANGISMVITAILTFWVPKVVSETEYGFWQLFLFYQGYLGFFHFGWNDGIYLRYGGKSYDSLDKKCLFSQFWMQAMLQSIFGFALIAFGRGFMSADTERAYICNMLAWNMFFLNIRYMLLYILQATARIKEYVVITLCDRIVYIAFCLTGILVLQGNYHTFLISDLLAKIISVGLACLYCKKIVLRKVGDFSWEFKESYANIKVGLNLLAANLAGMLVLGIIRTGIEKCWGIETFGKVSLTISLSQLCISFLNMISIILFPILRKMEDAEQKEFFGEAGRIGCLFLFGILSLYYPIEAVMSRWMPNYSVSIQYMALIFPVCFYEGKTALVNNTYLKTLRKEQVIKYMNWITVILSVGMTFITAYILNNLILTILLILVVSAARCIMADGYLYRYFKKSYKGDFLTETGMVIIFILSAKYLSGWKGGLLYVIVYAVYCLWR